MKTPAHALWLMATSFSAPLPVTAQESVSVSPRVVGRTPTHIGYVISDVLPGSNAASWLRYSEINAARLWWPYQIWPAPPARWQGDQGLARFESERALLRRDGAAQLDWESYREGVAKALGGKPEGTLSDAFVLSELKKMGAAPLLMLTHPRAQMTFNAPGGEPDWFGRWTYWRGIYVNALYLARTYGVERFQLFNEPDHSASAGFEQTDFLQRLQIGSDAIQAAIADANRLDNTKLTPRISAPVTAGMTVYKARQGRKDTRDSKIGWGELTTRAMKSDFPGRSADNRGLFQVYAFQNYSRTPSSVSDRLPTLIERITADNGGQPLPVIASEMNVSTAADFSKTEATLDTPTYYAAFGAIAAAYTNSGLNEGYVFRLTQTDNLGNGAIKKNGTHFLDNKDPLKNILGSTKGAEAARLWMRGFKGGRERFAAPKTPEGVHAAAARDQTDGAYTLLLSNLGLARNLDLDLSSWKLPTGALATVEEVNATHHGDVSRIFGLPASGKIALSMSADSVALLTVRPTISSAPRVLQVLADAAMPGVLRVAKPVQSNGRFVLALQMKALKMPLRVRVYGGAGAVSQAELLGQLTPVTQTGELLVDATRYVAAAKGQPLTFQIVPENDTALSYQMSGAELHVFDAPAA